MSHIVTIQTQVRDPAAISIACQRLQLPEPALETVALFYTTVTGWTVRLPQWTYAVVCDVEQAQLSYNNYVGRWGDQHYLELFQQTYTVENETDCECY